jgi:processing peptidase subunit beta
MSLRLLLSNVGKFSSVRYASSATSPAYEALKNNGDQSNLTSLDNGFRVASHSNGKSVATVGVWIDSGSRYENSDNNGVASLFEHLMYSGTSKKDAQQLQIQLAKLGANLNSVTTRDHTAYYVECLSGDVEKVVEILADVMQNTNFSTSQIEEQRNNVLAKLEESEKDFRGTVLDNLHKTAFQGNAYSLSPLGSKATVESLTKKDVENFVNDHYKASRMVLTGVGGVDHEQLSRLAEKHFGSTGNDYSRKIPDPSSVVGARFTGSEMMYRDDSYPYMFGAIAVESVPRNHKDYLPMLVASQVVGQYDDTVAAKQNYPNSLVQLIHEGTGLRSFENFSLNYSTTGLWGIYFVNDGDSINIVYNGVKQILNKWKHLSYSVPEEEVARARNSLITNVFSSLEDNSRLAHHLANEVLNCGTLTPLYELEQKINQVSSSDVREATSRQVYDRDVACAAIGKTEAWPDYTAVREGMSWWRL